MRTDDSEVAKTVWWKSAGSRPQTASIEAGRRYDVAIVGGGIAGLTAARHLARLGMQVGLFEADTLGSGASGVNGGYVVPNFAKADPDAVVARLGEDRGRRLLALVGAGADRVFATIRDNAIECDAEQVGWMHVAHDARSLDMLRVRATAWQKLGRPVRIFDEGEARARTTMRYCAGAYFDPAGGMLNPLAYTLGLARLAGEAGVHLHERARVATVVRTGPRWRLGFGDGHVEADRVVLATNASSIGAARRLFRTVVPLRVYQMATRPLAPAEAARIAPGRNPIADTRATFFTYRLDRDNRLISGGMPILPFRAHARMGHAIARRLASELGLADVPEVEHVWFGTAAMTTDFLPHVYELGPGFVGGIGCNGRGIALTTMLGEVLAQAASGTALADLPIPTAPARAIPFHLLARAAPSLAIMHAKWTDRHL
ncbi:MAG: FAD-binding oxidoreductase [Rhodospirillales bacterium]|nr:FAD-binding oxidoreductase [Rhodospirillales bacterium]